MGFSINHIITNKTRLAGLRAFQGFFSPLPPPFPRHILGPTYFLPFLFLLLKQKEENYHKIFFFEPNSLLGQILSLCFCHFLRTKWKCWVEFNQIFNFVQK